jgi:hypothetical protein
MKSTESLIARTRGNNIPVSAGATYFLHRASVAFMMSVHAKKANRMPFLDTRAGAKS